LGKLLLRTSDELVAAALCLHHVISSSTWHISSFALSRAASVMATSDNPESSTNSPQDPSQSPSFKRWLYKAGLVTGLAGTKEEQMANLQEYKHNTCEKWKIELMNYSQCLVRLASHPPVLFPFLIVFRCMSFGDFVRSGGDIYAQAPGAVWLPCPSR
jgi:hypothetical protein